MQRKSLTISRLTILGVLGLAGCHGWLPPPAAPEHHGVVLRVACPPQLCDLVLTQSRPWQAHQEARVETVGPDEKDSADIWIFQPDALPGAAAAGKLLPVPAALHERGNAYEWSALLGVYREQLLLWEHPAYALPLLGEAPVCLYRADLFSLAKHQQQFRAMLQKRGLPTRELRPPASWEDFALIAEYFQQAGPGGLATSLPPLPSEMNDLDGLFYTVAASYARRAVRQDEPAGPDHRNEVFAFHYQITGEPRIGSPGFVAALRMLQRLQKCRPVQARPHPEEAFRDGKAVLCITDASALLGVQQSALRDKAGICAVPGADRYFTPSGQEKVLKQGVNRVPYLGSHGWFAAVSAATRNPAAAFDLLADLTGPERSAQIAMEPRWGGGPIRVDQLMRERWDAFDLDAKRSRDLQETLGQTLMQHGLKNPLPCLRIPSAQQHKEVLAAQLRDALQGGDPAKALAVVARRWAEMDEKKGKDVHLREYRISLGLLDK